MLQTAYNLDKCQRNHITEVCIFKILNSYNNIVLITCFQTIWCGDQIAEVEVNVEVTCGSMW